MVRELVHGTPVVVGAPGDDEREARCGAGPMRPLTADARRRCGRRHTRGPIGRATDAVGAVARRYRSFDNQARPKTSHTTRCVALRSGSGRRLPGRVGDVLDVRAGGVRNDRPGLDHDRGDVRTQLEKEPCVGSSPVGPLPTIRTDGVPAIDKSSATSQECMA